MSTANLFTIHARGIIDAYEAELIGTTPEKYHQVSKEERSTWWTWTWIKAMRAEKG